MLAPSDVTKDVSSVIFVEPRMTSWSGTTTSTGPAPTAVAVEVAFQDRGSSGILGVLAGTGEDLWNVLKDSSFGLSSCECTTPLTRMGVASAPV